MKEFKGTKGEWRVMRKAKLNVEDSKGNCVASCGARFSSKEDLTDEQFANTKLVAAAPELLEALQQINIDLNILKVNIRSEENSNPNSRWEGMSDLVENWIKRNNKAINKALGE